MRTDWFLCMILCVSFLVPFCECRKQSRRKKIRDVEQSNPTSLVLEEESVPAARNRNRLYSPWSPWSKCSRKCKQMRTRHCRMIAECGANLLREERSCFKDRCKERQAIEEIALFDEPVSLEDENSPTEFRIFYHLRQPSPYSDWTEWSPCSRTCLAHRSRTCIQPEVCEEKVLHESALCYAEGTVCEKLYIRKRKQKKSTNGVVTDGPRIHPMTGLKCGILPQTPDLKSFLKIIGGREASRGSWPWQVAILNKHREPFCGGTLLTHGWVLTAAHCIRKKLVVRAGEHDLMSDEGTEQESRVLETFIHPDYDDSTVNNDIALLKLKQPVEFNAFAQPACLPSPTDELRINTKAIIIGWGKRKNTAIYGTDHLHQAEVPIVNLKDCRENYDMYHISNNMMCAGFKQGRVDTCAGDSGGPLLSQKDGKWTIYGITSFGEGCGRKGKYGIYANVPKFVRWIKKTIWRNS